MRPADNPFRADRIKGLRYRPQGWTWEDLVNRLQRLNYRAAIVGAHGSGKTRLMQELGARLKEQGLRVSAFRISPGSKVLPRGLVKSLRIGGDHRHLILLDEADQLSAGSRLVLRLLSRRAAGLIVTSHGAAALPTLVGCAASLELLEDILFELVGHELSAIRELSRRLFREHQGNVREVLRALYDVYADK
jgi:hypothetical protein